jgi:hypothetical protein
VLFGAVVDKLATGLAQPLHGKRWAGAVAQQLLQGGAIMRMDADAGVHREAAVCVRQHLFGLKALQHYRLGDIGLYSVVAAELTFGVAQSGSVRNRQALEMFLAPLTILPFDAPAVWAYGDLRANLERRGTPIGSLALEPYEAIEDMNARLGQPTGLVVMGVERDWFDTIITGAMADPCQKTNPRIANV